MAYIDSEIKGRKLDLENDSNKINLRKDSEKETKEKGIYIQSAFNKVIGYFNNRNKFIKNSKKKIKNFSKKYKLIHNINPNKNNIIIIILMLLLKQALPEYNLLKHNFSNITLKINGTGNKNVLSSSFGKNYYPNITYINGEIQSPIRNSYNFNQSNNIVELI